MPYLAEHTRGDLTRALNRLREAIYTPVAELRMTAWVTKEPVNFFKRTTGKKITPKKGEPWATLFDCAWFHFQGTVPRSARGQIVLLLDVHGELLVVDAKGAPLRGLTTKNSEFDLSHGLPGKHVHRISAKAGATVDVWADGACNDLFGRLPSEGRIRHADIAIEQPSVRALFHDLEVVLDLAQHAPANSARSARLWDAAERAVALLRDYTDDEAVRARAVLAPELARRTGDHPLTLSAVGHAHMDLAWLWPVRETKRKTARTFATVLRNMERYPDYVFGASQPQQYAWMKEAHPTLWKQIKSRVAEGRWEVQGGMWCEPDTNVTGGESLARQLLYGMKFWQQEFGKTVRDLWLPDVFGYCGSLPQLLQHAGIDRFMTIKLSWSNVNRHPHHTFHWQGIDGTSVLAHMPPEGTYNSSARPGSILATERNYADKGVSDRALLVYGIGDGGGGPGEDHLERLTRCKDLNGLPKVVQEPAIRFFDRLEKDAARFPTHVGELYLEKHQGTYTTQGRNKKWNRRMEWALRTCELANARAARNGRQYPLNELLPIWQEVLLYQFHDILPGSSITRVYEESLARYGELYRQTCALTAAAEQVILAPKKSTGSKATAVFNDLSWARSGWIRDGKKWSHVTVDALAASIVVAAGVTAAADLSATTSELTNSLLRVRIGRDGSLSSIVHLATGREILTGSGNRLAVYRDDGDAWDFSMNYAAQVPESLSLVSTTARIDGPQAIVTQTWRYGESTVTQDVVLTSGSGRLEFRTNADWRDGGRMLRTAFPVAVRASSATCHIQFGTIQRPTHRNTSWEMAKNEICAHTFVDLSEPTHGVALLNDGKYGHRAEGNVLDLNLLRTPGFPDSQADRCVHEFTYALYPHTGDHVQGQVLREGYDLNCPLRSRPTTSTAHPLPSFAQLDTDHVIIEAVKGAEDGNGTIFRLFEAAGAEVTCRLRVGFAAKKAFLTNLHEVNDRALKLVDDSVELTLRPFQIVTIRVH